MAERRIPKYRLHKHSGRGFVEIDRRRHYLGPYDDPATKSKYERIIREWKASGFQLTRDVPDDLTLDELCSRFLRHPEGPTASDLHNYKLAIRVLHEMYGDVPAIEFDALSLRAVRDRMVQQGCHTTGRHRSNRPPEIASRGYVNKQVNRIRRVFSWAVSLKLIPTTVLVELQSIPELKPGRTIARETEEIQPVPQRLIDAIKPHVSRQVWALVQLQLHCGARPSELLKLRPCDIDRRGEPWIYSPAKHKTAYKGHKRTIRFGPEAQKVIAPFLKERDADDCLFNPREAERERRDRNHERRTTPLTYGNIHDERKLEKALAKLATHYSRSTYRRAISRACDSAFPHPSLRPQAGEERAMESRKDFTRRLTVEQRIELREWQRRHRWNPYRLRHTAGTRFRDQFGLDVAQVVLGHRHASTTQIYAKASDERAAAAIAKAG